MNNPFLPLRPIPVFMPQPVVPVDPVRQACDIAKQLFNDMEKQVEGFDEFSASLDEMDRAHEYYTSLIDAMDPELVDEKLDAMDVVAFDLGTAHTRAQQAGRSLQLLSPSFNDMMIQLHRRVHTRPS